MKTVNYEPEDSIQLYSCMIYIGNNYCYNTDSVHNLVYNIIIALVIATTVKVKLLDGKPYHALEDDFFLFFLVYRLLLPLWVYRLKFVVANEGLKVAWG